ncbi:MAG: RNA polymerase sigma factor [Saprospiraceae bacterium]
MAINSNTQKNIGLTEGKFNQLVHDLQNGNELLFEKIFVSFFKKNQNILKAKYNASHEDAYDCVMWALLRMRQMLIEGKISYGNLNNYFIRMSVTRYIKTNSRKKEYSMEIVPEPEESEASTFDDETMTQLEKAWAKLGPPCKELLKGFYYDKLELKKLTEILNDSSTANTRKRKERCLKKLRTFFFELFEK